VPSQGERNQLLIAWAAEHSEVNLSDRSGYKNFSNNTYATQFNNDFLLPLAGYRSPVSSAALARTGYEGNFWSSSPDSSLVHSLYVSPSAVNAQYRHARANGISLRCFKNMPDTTKPT
jgi:hypothetical protein